MQNMNELDFFKVHLLFLHYLGVWPKYPNSKLYAFYSKIFIFIFILFYDCLLTLNLFFMPRILNNYVEELVFYFTELSVLSKVLTFYFLHDKLKKLFNTLQSESFQPITERDIKIISRARKFNVRYWKIIALVSCVSNIVHTVPPLINSLFGFGELKLLLCSYSFLSDEFKKAYIYPLYCYQLVSMHFHMWYNVNIDTLFLGLMIFTIAQLEILQGKLRKMTDGLSGTKNKRIILTREQINCKLIDKFNKSVIQFDEIAGFCNLIQQVFSVTLFIQFSVASCIICICLFRFTMVASWQYYIFLVTYMFVMVVQILVPCWFGTRITEKSKQLSEAIYDCDWVPRSRRFRSSMRFFVLRVNRPLALCGWNMFPLALTTFTSIMNSAYSFFTLLRHMKSRV